MQADDIAADTQADFELDQQYEKYWTAKEIMDEIGYPYND